MEHVWDLLTFAGEFLIVILGIAALLLVFVAVAARSSQKPDLEIEHLNHRFEQRARRLRASWLTAKEKKAEGKELKEKMKAEKTRSGGKPRTYVLDFKGDIKASATDHLREEISAILDAREAGDDVVLRLESPGGMVHGYGLAAAQLMRLKKAGVPLTICVDKVAASGGYMMACTAERICAAHFAIVGSIGVVAQVPNLHRLLRKHDVDYKEYTAGEYKRTVSFLGEITTKGEEKFREQLEETHVLFKSFIQENRPRVDLAKVATGEHWYGVQARDLALIDEVMTSDELLHRLAPDRRLIHVKFHKKQPMSEKLSGILGQALRRGLLSSVEELESRRWP
ncbi:MAG: protease SohB [Bdellovibrionaceae bacterium]|nr:protease SohB [Pseudobdellovibrionaceae bacterium]